MAFSSIFCGFLMKWALPFLCFADVFGNVMLDSIWILISGNGFVYIALFSCFFFVLCSLFLDCGCLAH